MHFDQNWANFIVSYFPQSKYLIWRDPRYNVAYWNLHYRGVHLHMVEDQVMYDQDPVVFMHFSGMSDLLNYNIESISRHQNRFSMADFPRLRPIFEKYLEMLRAEDAMRWRHVPYGFCCFDDGTDVPQVVRNFYAEVLDPGTQSGDLALINGFKERVAFDSPFVNGDSNSKVSLLRWMWQPVHHPNKHIPSWWPEIIWQIYYQRKDLQSRYPDVLGKDSKRLFRWFQKRGIKEYHLDEERMLSFFDRASRQSKGLFVVHRLEAIALRLEAHPY